MSDMLVPSEVKAAAISIVVTRADGRVEDLGAVAYWHQNPIRRWLWAACQKAGIHIPEQDILRYSPLDFLRRLAAGR